MTVEGVCQSHLKSLHIIIYQPKSISGLDQKSDHPNAVAGEAEAQIIDIIGNNPQSAADFPQISQITQIRIFQEKNLRKSV